MHDPREPQFIALKCILRYLNGTIDRGLYISSSQVDRFISYSVVDWVRCPQASPSTFGFYVHLSYNLISWSPKRQHVVSRSSVETEYMG